MSLGFVCKKQEEVRRIVGVKKKARSMDEQRREIYVRMRLTERLVKKQSQLRWVGHLVWMDEERKAKKVEGLREQGRRKRGTPSQRWEECVMRDLTKMGWWESGEHWLRIMGKSIVQNVGQYQLGTIWLHTIQM